MDEYKKHLNSLKKEELLDLVSLYNEYNHLNKDITKLKKNEIISYIIENINKYISFVITTMDKNTFKLMKKNIKDDKVIQYLNNYKLVIKDNIPDDILVIIKKIIKQKKTKNIIAYNDKIYYVINGIIIAYGTIYLDELENIIGKENLLLVKVNPLKNYELANDYIHYQSLKNKRKINSLNKNKDKRTFTLKEYQKLGNSTYHHTNRYYKKLINILKSNYNFKKHDIMFLDEVIIIPYLYNNVKDEIIALDNLSNNMDMYFEFTHNNLKKRIISYIQKIKEDFPIWEYWGKSINEVK